VDADCWPSRLALCRKRYLVRHTVKLQKSYPQVKLLIIFDTPLLPLPPPRPAAYLRPGQLAAGSYPAAAAAAAEGNTTLFSGLICLAPGQELK